MILFTEHDSPRLRYVWTFIGTKLSDTRLCITIDRQQFLDYKGPKINYSGTALVPDEVHIIPHGLLNESCIKPQTIVSDPEDAEYRFFCNEGEPGFDVLAAIFYLVTRYEEYLPHDLDSYGRYAHNNSVAFRNGFLNLPVVDRWIAALGEKLRSKVADPGLKSTDSAGFRPDLTYDIDMAFSYRHKSLLRIAGGFIKSIAAGDVKSVRDRLAVLSGKKPDPFDSFAWLETLHRRYDLHPQYFFLLAAKTGVYDKNNDPALPAMQRLVKTISASYGTGIHPSWRSGDDQSLVAREISTLAQLTGKPVIHSRQHYIRFTLPQTYRHLSAERIRHDHSMGYGSINGFRASTSLPFYWYDLENELQTELMVHPFCYMDANSFYEQKMNAAAAFDEMMHYYHTTSEVGGTMTMIWHNHFLGTDPRFEGWKEVYENFLKTINGG